MLQKSFGDRKSAIVEHTHGRKRERDDVNWYGEKGEKDGLRKARRQT